ncbi:MAG TPA: hypothetical protein VLI21_09185 [Casimicrobiaceae bacterium]|nr:hypothetical protein [Casimicrobiaceae bacterium]
MQLIESGGARPSPGTAASRVPQQYAQPSAPADCTQSGANASRFDEDGGAEETTEVVPGARDLRVADRIVTQAVIAHSIVAESMAGVAGNSAAPTHWTRILYYDFMDGNMRAIPRNETPFGKREKTRSRRNRSPLMQGAVLLAIYVAMYLIVALVIHVLSALDRPGRPSIGPDWARGDTSLHS